MPENWNARTFVTYGAPVKMIKSNLNFNTGFNYSRTPAVINGGTNVSHNYTVSQGVVLSSNISKSFDFTLSYTANYTIVENSVDNAQAGGNNYFTDLDQSIWFWNAAIGYKLLKDKSLEARIQAFDLLNQNKSIGREVTDTFIEDSITNVLTRYFMFSLTYTFRKF
jgi:hypothetical protein